MAAIAGIPSNNSPGLGGLPTPVLLALVGGGIGAVVLIRRKVTQNAGSGTSSDQQTLLPNTAIMLGSLQESVLNLQGQVGQSTVDLSSQLTGTQENLSTSLDALTSQTQQGFTDLQSNLTNIGKANTQTITDALRTQGDALAALIGQSAAANKAYNQSLGDFLSQGMTTIAAQHNAELAGIGALQQTQQGQSQILAALQGQVAGVGQSLSSDAAMIFSGQQAIRGDVTHNQAYYRQAADWQKQSAAISAQPPQVFAASTVVPVPTAAIPFAETTYVQPTAWKNTAPQQQVFSAFV